MDELTAKRYRDIWQSDNEEKLEKWREFRLELPENTLSALHMLQEFWNFAPMQSISIDPWNTNSWLTLWEMLMQNEVCKYSKGVALSLSMYYVNPDLPNNIYYVNDRIINDTYIAAIINDTYLVNFQNFQVSELNTIDTSLLEFTNSLPAKEIDRLLKIRE